MPTAEGSLWTRLSKINTVDYADYKTSRDFPQSAHQKADKYDVLIKIKKLY
ncbi:MAG: hypothetical protein E7B59_01385 [Enterobacteriaceae bacterium]|nr:hypothetical protein [Enterobacteriaceae bacterium]